MASRPSSPIPGRHLLQTALRGGFFLGRRWPGMHRRNKKAAAPGGRRPKGRKLRGGPGRPGLRGLDVADRDLAGAAVFLRVEGDLLALDEAAHAGALESGRMDEHVLAAVVGLDEAEAFLIVVELHGAGVHVDFLFTDTGAHGLMRRARAKPRSPVRRVLERSLKRAPGSQRRRSGPVVRPKSI